MQFTIYACPDSHKCYNGTFKLERKKQSVTVIEDWIGRSCVNATYCADLVALVAKSGQDNMTKVIAGNASCCDGDFCNIGNSSINNKGIYSKD
jgi:hypothetical protein